MAHKKNKTKQQQIQSVETQQPAIIDLTKFYDKEISIDDVWNNINSIAGKELLPTGEDGIYFAIANTLKKKDHVIRGGGKKNRRQNENQKIYLTNLQKIVKNAKYVGTDNNNEPKNKNKRETIAYHYFESTVKIRENFYKLRFSTEEYTEREIERLKKIGKLPLSTVSSEKSNLQNVWQSSPNEHSISFGKNLSSRVPKILYLYNIKEQSLGKNYLNQIQNSQNQSPIQTDIRSMQIQKETHSMENENTQTQEQQRIEQNVTNTLIDKIRKTGLDVIIDKEKMREILESGQYVQKMAAYHGTSHENESETFFNGYGTYVVSVNENYAKQHGLKIASKKYGDTFYVKEQTLDNFLSEHNFSPYWNELIKQSNFRSPDELNSAMMFADTKGNGELERQKDELSTLFKYSLIEYKKEQTYLYSVDIPDNTGSNYLLYNNPIGLESANRINAELEKMNVEWKVSRNDTGRQVYFDVLSKNLFNGNQKTASEFLKNCGYVGMVVDSTNYIVFDENDMNVKNRLQYMIDGNNNVLGLAAGNAVILDPDFLNSNTPAHEYNHFWDRCIRQSNPELIAKGIDIFKETNYWSDVEKLQSYKEGWSKLMLE